MANAKEVREKERRMRLGEGNEIIRSHLLHASFHSSLSRSASRFFTAQRFNPLFDSFFSLLGTGDGSEKVLLNLPVTKP